MIVADTNLISYLLIKGDQTEAARAVFRKDPIWAAPVLWRSEFRNVLALYIRRHHLRLEDALRFSEEAELLLETHEYQVDSSEVLRLVHESGCSAYDCEFVHLAQGLSVPLVTSDRAILRAFPRVARSMTEFAA